MAGEAVSWVSSVSETVAGAAADRRVRGDTEEIEIERNFDG